MKLTFDEIAKKYKGSDDSPYCHYRDLLDNFGDVLISEDYGSYQGDTFAIIKNENQYGFLNFGWGSCSGCDALEACDTQEELKTLAETLYNDIKWFESIDLLKKWILEVDEERVDGFYRLEEEWKLFQKLVENLK